MTKHLLKLLWKRRKFNILLVLEIFISFIVVFVVTTMGMTNWRRYNAPIGFEYENVYSLGVDERMYDATFEYTEEDKTRHRAVLKAIEQMPGVEAITITRPLPLGMATYRQNLEYNEKSVDGNYIVLSKSGLDVFNLELVAGRWFNEDDDVLDWEPVIIDQRMADALFGDEDPVGKKLDGDEDQRIVGVVSEFRHRGRLWKLRPVIIDYQSVEKAGIRSQYQYAILTTSGISSRFESEISDLIKSYLGEVSVSVEPLTTVYSRNILASIVPLLILSLVGSFLIIMVILGMIGVFWQSVTGRTDEIGLRRALGGSRDRVYTQILGEIVILTSIGVIAALVLLIQIPLIGIVSMQDLGLADPGDSIQSIGPFPAMNWGLVLSSLGTALLIMYGLAILSGLYPAWLASRIQPAAALHYE